MYALRNTARAKRLTGLAVGALLVVLSSSALAADSARPASSAEYPLVVLGFATTPKQPRAGKPFTAGALIMNDETGGPASGQVRCRAKVRGNAIRVRFKAFDDGVALCEWKVPAAAGGRRFVSSIEVVAQDDYSGSTYSASIPFTKVIRR
jgi:hypothetical protein